VAASSSKLLVVPSRLDDRIRELCAKVIQAHGSDFGFAVQDLQDALRQHATQLREMAAEKLTRVSPHAQKDEHS